jgi:hypothetical protein
MMSPSTRIFLRCPLIIALLLAPVAISVLTAMPAFAQAPTDRPPAKPTMADVQKVVQTISGDKAKLQTYCDLDKLHQQIADASKDTKTFEKTFADLGPKAGALVEKLGPDYTMLMDGLDQADENSGEGKDIAASSDEITAAFKSLDKLCK